MTETTSLCDAPEPPSRRHPIGLRDHLPVMHATIRLFRAFASVILTLSWDKRGMAEQRTLLRAIREFRNRLLEPVGYEMAHGHRRVNTVLFHEGDGYVYPHTAPGAHHGPGRYPARVIGCTLRVDGSVDLLLGALYPATPAEAGAFVGLCKLILEPPTLPEEQRDPAYWTRRVGYDKARDMNTLLAASYLQSNGDPETAFKKFLAEYHLPDPRPTLEGA